MARVSLKEGELGVALGNGRPLASIRVQILVKTIVNDKRQKARIPETKLQWLPARHAILTSGSGRTLNGRESLRAGRDAQLLPCRPAVRYPGPNAHTGPDGRTSVNQPSVSETCHCPVVIGGHPANAEDHEVNVSCAGVGGGRAEGSYGLGGGGMTWDLSSPPVLFRDFCRNWPADGVTGTTDNPFTDAQLASLRTSHRRFCRMGIAP